MPRTWTDSGLSRATADGRYLKLDCSNDPLTGTLNGNHLEFLGHSAFGSGSSVNPVLYVQNLDETFTLQTGTRYGYFTNVDLQPAGALSGTTVLIGADIQAEWNGGVDGAAFGYIQGIKGEANNIANSTAINELTGMYGKARSQGGDIVTAAYGVRGDISNDDALGHEAGDITKGSSLVAGGYTDKGTGIIITRYGLEIEDITGGGLVTNQYGIYCPALSAAGTDNYFIKNASAPSDFGTGNISTTGSLTVGSAVNTEQLIIKANASQTNANPLIFMEKANGEDLLAIHSDDYRNIFIGLNAGSANAVSGTDGINNLFIGYEAGEDNTSGMSNVFIGYQAGQENVGADSNLGIGTSALRSNISGTANMAIGSNALFLNLASYNTAIGLSAGFNSTNGNSNLYVGVSAGYYNKTGNYNVCLGRVSGYGGTDAPVLTVDTIVQPTGALNNGTWNAVTTTKTEGEGDDNLTVNVTIAGGVITDIVVNAAGDRYSLNDTITLTGLSAAGGGGNDDGTFDVATINQSYSSNVFIGYGSGHKATTGGENVAIGANSLGRNESGAYNVCLGGYAGYGQTGLPTSRNVYIGYYAGRWGTAANGYNVAIGDRALLMNETGTYNVCIGGLTGTGVANNSFTQNVFIGGVAGTSCTTGSYNTAIGVSALKFNKTGAYNVFIGTDAAFGVSGNSCSNNTGIGRRAMYYVTTGSNNTVMGYRVADSITTGSNNILIGYQAGDNLTTGTDNIIIGYDLNASAVGVSNELNIGGLIKGDTSALTLILPSSVTLKGTDTDDPRITFDSGNDGYIEWQEDEQQFHIEGGIEMSGSMSLLVGTHFLPPAVNDAGMDDTAGTIGEIVFNTADATFYGCTETGDPAVWAAFH